MTSDTVNNTPDKDFSALDQLVLQLVNAGRLPRSSPHDCSYLEGQQAIEEGFMVEELHPELYHDLMNRRFRRSGHVLYRPQCEGCQACTPLRIPVNVFEPSRSQRRAMRKNKDVLVRFGPPHLDERRLELYGRYLEMQHPGSPQSNEPDSLKNFLYTTCVETIEVTYELPDGALIGVSILDISSQSLSSVYHFFDPRERRRSIGVFSAVTEIELCRQWGIPYYYLGYWIAGSATMAYKAQYYPHELMIDGVWERQTKPPKGASKP